MAMGSKEEKQEELFYAREQAEAPAPVLPEAEHGVERREVRRILRRACRRFYHTKLGARRCPGRVFPAAADRIFEGIASERGICWRVADSLSLRRFLNYGLGEATPDT